LGFTEEGESLVYTAKSSGTRNHAEFAPDTVFQTPFRELAGEGLRMDNWDILPSAILAIHGITVPYPKVVQVNQYGGVIKDNGQWHAI